MSGTGTGDGGRGKTLFDDLAGVAGGAFSMLAGARAEAEAAVKSQVDAMVQRLELVRREEFDAALEVARRAREHAEALELRVLALEARAGAGLGASGGRDYAQADPTPGASAQATAEASSSVAPGTVHPAAPGGTVPAGSDAAAAASAGVSGMDTQAGSPRSPGF